MDFQNVLDCTILYFTDKYDHWFTSALPSIHLTVTSCLPDNCELFSPSLRVVSAVTTSLFTDNYKLSNSQLRGERNAITS